MKGPQANESEAYRRARAVLLEAEIAVRDQCERVAALRRKLPIETDVEDYLLEEGPEALEKEGPFTRVRLSGLFTDVNKPLVVYQYMYGGAQKKPCPMCTLWIDGFNGAAHHLRQRVNFAVIAQVAIGELREWGRQRGWHRLRLVSSAGSNFKADLQYQDADGSQHPGICAIARGLGEAFLFELRDHAGKGKSRNRPAVAGVEYFRPDAGGQRRLERETQLRIIHRTGVARPRTEPEPTGAVFVESGDVTL